MTHVSLFVYALPLCTVLVSSILLTPYSSLTFAPFHLLPAFGPSHSSPHPSSLASQNAFLPSISTYLHHRLGTSVCKKGGEEAVWLA